MTTQDKDWGDATVGGAQERAPLGANEVARQVEHQCRVVAHLATAIADIHRDLAWTLRDGAQMPWSVTGPRTAALMETLGDILNNMDAAESNDWIDAVFERSQKMFPAAEPGDVP